MVPRALPVGLHFLVVIMVAKIQPMIVGPKPVGPNVGPVVKVVGIAMVVVVVFRFMVKPSMPNAGTLPGA